MKIFISYAHVDFARVKQLADLLQMGGHDVWYDQRLVGGQPWKKQLRSQIKTSSCFVYALTPESIASPWCQWEFAQAVHMGKKIVTVLLQTCDREGVLDEHQYVDFTAGDSLEAGLRLGTAMFAAQPIPPERVPLLLAPDDIKPEREITHAPPVQPPLVQQLYNEALQLYREKAYTDAQELVDDLLHVAPDHADARQLSMLIARRIGTAKQQATTVESDLTSQTPLDPPISTVPKISSSSSDKIDSSNLDTLAWLKSLAPSHDAKIGILDESVHFSSEINSRETTRPSSLNLLPTPFDWIEIPGKGYSIAKYPVTNAQFAKFIDAGGYQERKWWTDAGWVQRGKDGWSEPRYWNDSQWNGAEQPVVGVSWYETVAFCLWLSDATGEQIMLPTEEQWQYAAQGNDGRKYPWGNEWDCKRCNNSVKPCDSNATTPVTQYEGKDKGNSYFGVVDMVGNVWEWCQTDYENKTNDMNNNANKRALSGGSWYDIFSGHFRCDFRYGSIPLNWLNDWGFRLARS